MDAYTLSPTVEASNLIRIRPDGLHLDELSALKQRGDVVWGRLRELAGAGGYISANERANIRRRIVEIELFIAHLNDAIQAAQLVAMYQATQGTGDDSDEEASALTTRRKKAAAKKIEKRVS